MGHLEYPAIYNIPPFGDSANRTDSFFDNNTPLVVTANTTAIKTNIDVYRIHSFPQLKLCTLTVIFGGCFEGQLASYPNQRLWYDDQLCNNVKEVDIPDRESAA